MAKRYGLIVLLWLFWGEREANKDTNRHRKIDILKERAPLEALLQFGKLFEFVVEAVKMPGCIVVDEPNRAVVGAAGALGAVALRSQYCSNNALNSNCTTAKVAL